MLPFRRERRQMATFSGLWRLFLFNLGPFFENLMHLFYRKWQLFDYVGDFLKKYWRLFPNSTWQHRAVCHSPVGNIL